MPDRSLRCILHIGTEKTGTTTIQRFLSMNRGALRQTGILYSRSAGDDGESQWGFVCATQDAPWRSDIGKRLNVSDAASQADYASRLFEAVKGELDQGPAVGTLIISSEHMHSRLRTPEEIERLKGFLSPLACSFEVVVYFRRQDRMAASLFSTAIKAGRVDPVPFPGIKELKVNYYYDFFSIYRNWASVFGEDCVKVRVFDKSRFVGGDLITDFCALAGLSCGDLKKPGPANESLSLSAAAVANAFSRRYSQSGGAKVGRVAGFLQSQLGGQGIRFARADAIKFCGLYAESNARLKQELARRGIDFDFDEDFSHYAEDASSLEPSLDDAMAAFYRLWLSSNPDERGRHDRALNEKIRHLEADNAYLRGRMALMRGEIDAARELFDNALELDDGHKLAAELRRKLDDCK